VRRVTLSVAALALVLFGVGAAVALGGPSGGGQLPTIADEPPTLSIDDVTAGETNFDTDAVLTIALSGPSTKTVTVHWATADGTADSTDYLSDDGTATFPPGTTAVRIAVLIKGDGLDEPDETFFVDLSEAEGATIAKARGVVTISDDDPLRIFPVNAAVRASWRVHRAYTSVARLIVASAPAGASVEAHCQGKGCPFASRAAGRNLSTLFRGARLRPGSSVQVWIDAPGTIGRAFVYAMRRSEPPRATTLCLPGAATKPVRC
jgi:hypothetical protein